MALRPFPSGARFPAAAALVAAFLAAPASVASAAEGTTYHTLDVTLAPIAVDGEFPVTVDTGAGPAFGTLRVDTDVRGKLSGRLDLGGSSLEVTGTAKAGGKGTRVDFTARAGSERLTFSGRVEGSTLVGRLAGHGAGVAGKRDCTVNLGTARPLTVLLDCAVTEDAKGRLTGHGQAAACGETLVLRVTGKRTSRRMNLGLASGKSFTFSGSGPGDTDPLALDWRARGFGASASGDAAPLAPFPDVVAPAYQPGSVVWETEAPVDPLAPAAGAAPRGAFSVSPDLPAGLVLDPDTGAISGTPTEIRDAAVYTVTASNFGGSRSGTVTVRTRIPRARSFDVETRALSDDDLRHFLVRTQFAATPAAISGIRTAGLDATLDRMLLFAQNTPADTIAAPELRNATDPPGLEGMYPSTTQLGRWWSSILMNTDNPFQERVAFFWHDHFAASSDVLDGGETYFMVNYVNLFRHHGNGNLRQLLLDLARDPCMLKFLDGYRNTVSRPNENFAREFWELFTLGVDNGYTQADIVEGARAFTGWKRVTDPNTGLVSMVFDTRLHDPNAKTVLGQTIPAQNLGDDYAAMVDLTLAHRPVAEFVATKLFEHFCYDDPPPELVAAMAAYLREQDYELSPFLRRLVSCEAFFSAKARKSLVKNPVDFAMGFIHATGLKIQVSTLGSQLTTLGQFPTQPPTVNGWPLGDLWLSSQNMADRINLAYACVEDTTRQRSVGIEVANILPPVAERTAANVVDTLAALLRTDLAAAERQTCIDYLNTQRQSNGTVVASPFDGSNQTHLDERVRGLLWILAQHPSTQVR